MTFTRNKIKQKKDCFTTYNICEHAMDIKIFVSCLSLNMKQT